MQIITHPLLGASLGTRRELISLHYGSAAGPKVYIQASLHADELPGMLVAHHLRRELDALEAQGLIRGQVVLVPLANPIGLSQWLLNSQHGRFDLNSGENFNRHYGDLVQAVAERVATQLGSDALQNVALIRQALRDSIAALPAETELQDLRRTLMSLSMDAEVVLDLHCDAEAVLHLYTGTDLWPQCEPLARYLGAHATLLAKESGGEPFDEACSKIWWQLHEHFEGRHPIPPACLSVTVELRGQRDVSHALAAADARGILNFLRHRGVIDGPVPGLLHGASGVLSFLRLPGEVLRAGEVLAELIDPLTAQVTELKAPVDGVLYAHINGRFVTTGTKVAKIAGQHATRTGNLLGS
jgi:predicted deacylase